MFKNTIDKNELKEFPRKHFEGKIFLIENYSQIDFAVNILKKEKILGFDTETRPAFKKGKYHQVALLQLSTSTQAFLFKLKKTRLPETIIDVLSSESIIKVGAAIRDDIKALRKITLFEPAGFIELQNYIKNFGIESFSLQKMSAIVLGFNISKSKQLSNWDLEKYSEAQKIYAATDAWVSLEIYKGLSRSEL